jgi:hypothetical protein
LVFSSFLVDYIGFEARYVQNPTNCTSFKGLLWEFLRICQRISLLIEQVFAPRRASAGGKPPMQCFHVADVATLRYQRLLDASGSETT